MEFLSEKVGKAPKQSSLCISDSHNCLAAQSYLALKHARQCTYAVSSTRFKCLVSQPGQGELLLSPETATAATLGSGANPSIPGFYSGCLRIWLKSRKVLDHGCAPHVSATHVPAKGILTNQPATALKFFSPTSSLSYSSPFPRAHSYAGRLLHICAVLDLPADCHESVLQHFCNTLLVAQRNSNSQNRHLGLCPRSLRDSCKTLLYC